MSVQHSSLSRKVGRALKTAHELADQVARNYVVRRQAGQARLCENFWYDTNGKRWLEPPENANFYIVGADFSYTLTDFLDGYGELAELDDWWVVSNFMVDVSDYFLEANERGHEAALSILQSDIPERHGHFRIVLTKETAKPFSSFSTGRFKTSS